ncbi:hypothetical protein PI23P_07490 [Polaribacter irgensii 23-P]|uniref:Uncharacterized protein n=1 Tax=Polaribacter irgensii 23-P TaxID=313594 RepID=A4BZ57_9FLAO|nr:hypothetical protein [Polaribacter irgensii]EAR12450.1 hypothetical protein PI23P_07490 [Polaribacter irgensii 23-P]
MKVFKEEQRFTQTWLFANLSIGIAVSIIVIARNTQTQPGLLKN